MIMIDFRDFTGWVLVYKTNTQYPLYREDKQLETANSYKEIEEKRENAIHEYNARECIIYYVVDGIAEKVINNFNIAIKNMRGKKK